MPNPHRQDTEDTENTMSPSTSISPAPGSTAAIVGTPPTAQRSAGDGSPATESFAMALNHASSPPPAAASAREELGFDTGPDDAAAQRKAAAAAADAVDEKSQASGLDVAPAPTEAGAVVRATPAQDRLGADRADDTGDATSDASALLAALFATTPAASDRAAGKSALPPAGAGGVTAASRMSRGGATPALDAASAVAAGASRRGETGADALVAAGERDVASRLAAAAAAPAATAALPATATPLSAPLPVMSAAAAGSGPPTAAEARLQAPPGSAGFAPALGAQLNVFLRDGVQHARLHLHPAELGPLTVQIQLDGATAQVRLAAEHPLTRQALEQAMPTLAGTLRESGLTLTGGGVFEQPANPQPQQDGRTPVGGRGPGDRESRDGTAQAEAAPLRMLAPRRGVVDLVA